MNQTRLMLRLPADARAFIGTQADRNGSSLNSEIIRLIRDRMDQETKTATTEPGRAE